ncbi:UNKNOWN [Stylonychia lemnae]|uniref:Uncharacterized protein n=1 Tax=Stylonychia lemnae TaxID=5949 RepID=A0A078A8S5_STYLE|nr:UNKNOWN [Stylonychia lemnae]|eukprot:CDW77191.1 UNKNOWN [Stylonychia lemnae]
MKYSSNKLVNQTSYSFKTSIILNIYLILLMMSRVECQSSYNNITLSDLLEPSAVGLCHKCFLQNDSSMYVQDKPSCYVVLNGQKYVPPAFKQIKQKDCYNLGDYYTVANQYCTGQITSLFSCTGNCAQTDVEKNVMYAGQTYTISADSRCQYKLFLSNDYNDTALKTQKMTYIDQKDSNITFFIRRNFQYYDSTYNFQLVEFNIANPIYNASYILVVNTGNKAQTFKLKTITGGATGGSGNTGNNTDTGNNGTGNNTTTDGNNTNGGNSSNGTAGNNSTNNNNTNNGTNNNGTGSNNGSNNSNSTNNNTNNNGTGNNGGTPTPNPNVMDFDLYNRTKATTSTYTMLQRFRYHPV